MICGEAVAEPYVPAVTAVSASFAAVTASSANFAVVIAPSDTVTVPFDAAVTVSYTHLTLPTICSV